MSLKMLSRLAVVVIAGIAGALAVLYGLAWFLFELPQRRLETIAPHIQWEYVDVMRQYTYLAMHDRIIHWIMGIVAGLLVIRWLLASSRRQLKLAYGRGLGDGAQLELRRQLRWR